MTDRKTEILNELLKMAKGIGVEIMPNEVYSFEREPFNFIVEKWKDNNGDKCYWRDSSNFNRTGFDRTKAYKLHAELKELKENELKNV